MSARRHQLDLSTSARQDFSDILVYTEQQWGKPQRVAYKAALTDGLNELRRHPNLGRSRADLRPGLRSFQIRHHVVFYRIEAKTIRVDRILHDAMDPASRLGE